MTPVPSPLPLITPRTPPPPRVPLSVAPLLPRALPRPLLIEEMLFQISFLTLFKDNILVSEKLLDFL